MANLQDSAYLHKNLVLHKNDQESSQIVVVMLPFPAQGHLNQLLHLSRLISSHEIPVHYTAITTHILQARSRVHGWNPSAIANIRFHEFPTTPFDNPSPNPNQTETKFPVHMIPSFTTSTHLREPFYEYVKKVSTTVRKVVVIYDSLMSYVVQDIDLIPNVDPYCFRSISAFTFYTFKWDGIGRPNVNVPSVAEVLNEVPSLEGCFPPEFTEFRMLQRNAKIIFSGDIYNSNRNIEGDFLDLLSKEKTTGTENVWALGPFNLVTNVSNDKEPSARHKCLEWLDKQEENSVMFVSFGTTSSISEEQIKEIAFGLKQSEQKFVWVLRDADKGDVFAGDVRRAQLPEGFEESIEGTGFIIRDWAPQLEILGHSATGGFMSHCGWNSCMESISMGVPLATWPMHSDQPSNAILVTKALKIGVEVKIWSCRDEVVSSFAIGNAVRRLMASTEGDEIRKRASELGDRVRKSTVEGGNGYKEMDSFINHITRRIRFEMYSLA